MLERSICRHVTELRCHRCCGWCKTRALQSPAYLNTASPYQQRSSRELSGVFKEPLQCTQKHTTKRKVLLTIARNRTQPCTGKYWNHWIIAACAGRGKLPSLPPLKHLPGAGRCFTKHKLHVSAKNEEHNSACWYFLPALVSAVCRIMMWVLSICTP